MENCLKKLMDSSSRLPSSPLGDCIGTESCIDLSSNDAVVEKFGSQNLGLERRRIEREGKLATKREFPPPIPSLARTENLSSHMPWILKRYYTEDGRLVLKEERVKHHEYFLAQRSNGRLTLQLIPLDDEIDQNYPIFSSENSDEEEEKGEKEDEEIANGELEEGEEEEAIDFSSEENDEAEEVKESDYSEDQRKNSCNNGGIGGNLSPPFKCLNYSTLVQSPASIFPMPVPALRPVHT